MCQRNFLYCPLYQIYSYMVAKEEVAQFIILKFPQIPISILCHCNYDIQTKLYVLVRIYIFTYLHIYTFTHSHTYFIYFDLYFPKNINYCTNFFFCVCVNLSRCRTGRIIFFDRVPCFCFSHDAVKIILYRYSYKTGANKKTIIR